MQRPGKTHRAGLGDDNQLMRIKNFMQMCAEVLGDNDNDSSAFWFEQIVDHIMDGGSIPTERKEVSRILGL